MCEEHSVLGKGAIGKRVMDRKLLSHVFANLEGKDVKEIIPSTMGEPLLYPHFEELVSSTQSIGARLNLTTNGTWHKRGAVGWAEYLLPICSDIKISMNGACSKVNESIMTGIDHEKQLADLNKLLEIRDEMGLTNSVSVTIQATFMESNISEMPALVRLAAELGVDRFKGHHMFITWPELASQSLLMDKESRDRWNATVESMMIEAKGHYSRAGKPLKLENVHPIPTDTTGNGPDPSWGCPFIGREAWVSWDGQFNVCCCPDPIRRGFGYFGHIGAGVSLMDLWGSPKYAGFVEGWGSYPQCATCNMRRPREERR